MFTWLNGSDTQPPAMLEVRSSKFFIIGSVCAAVFTDLFLYGIIVPVMPFALSNRANVPEDEVQKWVSILLAVYGGALFVACPFCGWFADRSVSRKMPLLVGLLALAGATAILTAGSSIGVLVLGRILQGLSAAVVWVVGLALVADTVGPEGVGEAMGYLGIAMSVGVLISPLIGGVVFDKAGYYAVFAISFALLGVDIVLRLALIEKSVAAKWISEKEVTDGQSAVLEVTTPEALEAQPIAPTKLAESQDTLKETDPKDGNISAVPVSPTTMSPPDSPVSAPKPKRKRPVYLVLLSSRRLLVSCLGCCIQSILMTSFDAIVPLFTANTFHWNSIGAGLIFIPVCVPSFTAPLIGMLCDRYGPRYLTTAGFLLNAPLMILLRLVDHDSMGQKVLFCALLFLVGWALNLALTPIMAEVTYCVEEMERKLPPGTFGKNGAMAQGYGLFNMAFAAGSMAGPLMSGLLVQNSGWPMATLVLGVLSAAWALPTIYWTGGSLRKQKLRKNGQTRDTEL